MKHASDIQDLKAERKTSHDDHEKMRDAIKNKIDNKWLFALIPILLAWAGSQIAVYVTVQDIKMQVAVVETKVELWASDPRDKVAK